MMAKVYVGALITGFVVGQWLNLPHREITVQVFLKRRILFPWLLSAVVMFGVSALWHGLALTDLNELKVNLNTYFVLSGLAYLIIGLGLSLLIRLFILREWISLKWGFPWKAMVIGASSGIFVYFVIFATGLSFASHGIEHVVVDILWQVLEQGIGGLMVSVGIIYDLHRSFMESEQAH